ncbi:sodium-coupled neutral amino acid transporter 4-like, partial [Centroberyx affinis]|uniref:sodium-coupled neutral amino acid transporter 4-like n=1 Tax=Centroberyx affinis TaxID=166261 RepID=UPI003A5C6624
SPDHSVPAAAWRLQDAPVSTRELLPAPVPLQDQAAPPLALASPDTRDLSPSGALAAQGSAVPGVLAVGLAFSIRSSITTLLFSGREFSWTRHLLIAAAILAFNNMLVIFVPTIRDIFGFIGSSAATMLIFILPAAFYLRLVKSVPFRSPQKIGAAIFLVVGIIFMIGSLSLIVMDWIHNPPGTGGH